MRICGDIINLSKKLYSYKPVLLSLALCSGLSRISDELLDDYTHIVPDRDDRKCQILLNFDRLHGMIEEAIVKYGLNRPGLFTLNYIDRNAITHYIIGEEVRKS